MYDNNFSLHAAFLQLPLYYVTSCTLRQQNFETIYTMDSFIVMDTEDKMFILIMKCLFYIPELCKELI